MTAGTEIAGLPLLRRVALAAQHAGFDRIVNGSEPASSVPAIGRSRIVVLAGDVIPQPQWLRSLLVLPVEPETLVTDDGTVAVIESDRADDVLTLLDARGTAAQMIGRLRGRFHEARHAFDPGGRFRIASGRELDGAERWLLRSLIKDSEGFMSRHLERRVSLAITRRLAATRITPNAVTLISIAIGLVAAPFFLSSSPPWQIVGALLFLLHSIVDGCDGELARLKFLQSRSGAILDFWGDNVVHVAVFGSMGIGWAWQAHAAWPLAVAAVSVASTLGAAAAVARYTMSDVTPGGSQSFTGRVVGALAHRDFIYVIVALAVMGKASWFLVLSAIGTPVFLLLLALSGTRTDTRATA